MLVSVPGVIFSLTSGTAGTRTLPDHLETEALGALTSTSAPIGAQRGASVAAANKGMQRKESRVPVVFSFPSGDGYFALKVIRAIRSGETGSVLVRAPGFCSFLLNQMKYPKVMPALGLCIEMNYQIVLVKVSF